MSKNTKKTSLLLAAVSAGLGAAATVHADTPITSFTPGDLVVLRSLGTNGQATGTTAAAYLDEYTTAGAYVGTINVPAVAGGGNGALTLTLHSGSHEGLLNLSANSQYLTFTGYSNAVGTNPNTSAGAMITVGLIGSTAASLNTSTQLTYVPGATAGETRAAVTTDGNEFYVSEGGGTNASQGLQYVPVTGATASAHQLAINNVWDTRDLTILNNQTLIAGSGSSSVGGHGVWEMGSSSAAPTTSLPTAGVSQTSDYQINNNATDGTSQAFAYQPNGLGTYQGQDVLYTIGGGSTAQTISKYAFNSSDGHFDLVNSFNPALGTSAALIGLTEQTDPTNPNNIDLFYTQTGTGTNLETGEGVYELVDSSNSAFGALSSTSTLLISAGSNDGTVGSTNDFIEGIAFAPGTTSVPEPASLGLLAVAGMGMLARRRRA